MDIRVAEGVYAEKIVHYHNKAIGGVSNRVAAAGGGLVCAPTLAAPPVTIRNLCAGRCA